MKLFDWINRHARGVVLTVVVAALALGAVASSVADTSDPNFDPAGQVFDVAARADAMLQDESSLDGAGFLVESRDGGDVLTAAAMREWHDASMAVRSDTRHQTHLVQRWDADLQAEVPGVLSIVDLVDDHIEGGLANATDAEVKAALAEILAAGSDTEDMRFTLSEQATFTDGTWSSPAFMATVTYDHDTFGEYIESELWLRDVQSDFQSSSSLIDPVGVAIDFDQTFDEAIQASAPFIFLAVALIVLLVAIVHHSYWSAVLIGAGLGVTMLAYNGIAALVGLKMGSLLLTFIVPIAMISFGVDFYIHGAGRVREMQVERGMDRRDAYPAGMSAVFLALLLAAVSSVAAFLSNVSSGTEAIIQFGLGAALALALAYLFLGLIAPRVLVGIEQTVGPDPIKGRSRWVYRLVMVPVVVISGLAVTLGAVMPAIGVAAVGASLLLLIAVPAWLTRRRNRRAVASGKPVSDVVRGAAHGLEGAGWLVRGLAARRIITIPIVLIVGAVGLMTALRVESGFELRDFLSSNTGVVQSIDRFEEHFPSNGQGGSYIYVEGDLTRPETLIALDEAVSRIDESAAGVGRYSTGELITAPTATDLVRATMESPVAVATIAASGSDLTDVDGNGLPDTPDQVTAVYDFIVSDGVLTADGVQIFEPSEVGRYLFHDGTNQATAITVQVGSFTDRDVIQPVWDLLEAEATTIAGATSGLTMVAVSGDVIAQFVSLESFADSMLVSLPIAILLTLLVATALLRSFRFAVASVVPIGFVVTGVYAFMVVAGYTINIVTATIAAIAVGVGIDFSTHLTARYREELAACDEPLEALRTAGAGTGGALVLSALTSVLGFTVMAFAPTPIFSTYGVLTAVMITLALIASLVVLPSVLILVTPNREPLIQRTLPKDKEWVLAR